MNIGDWLFIIAAVWICGSVCWKLGYQRGYKDSEEICDAAYRKTFEDVAAGDEERIREIEEEIGVKLYEDLRQ